MKKNVLFLILPFVTTLSFSQNIYTFAGNGSNAFSGDGGQAILASVSAPGDVAVDNSGNVYIADRGWHIRKVDATGIISTIAGTTTQGYSGDGGQATAAQLNQPVGITTYSGTIYFCDISNNAVRKIDPSGIISTIAGNGTQGNSGDGGPSTSAVLNQPISVAVDNNGNIFIADFFNHSIRKINTSGIITTIAGNGNGYSGDGGPAINSKLFYPSGVKTDNSGNIYITDWGNNRIRKINSSGIISTIAGTGVGGYSGDGGSATLAKISAPHGIAIDASGNIFFSEINNHIIRKINTSGIISTVVGSGLQGFSGDYGLATNAKLENPWGIAIDAVGNIYLADVNNFRVRVVCQNSCLASTNDLTNDKISFSIFPNPTSRQLNITTEQNNFQNSKLEIINSLGQTVLKTEFKNQIDVSELASGFYTLLIKDNSGSVITKKFVKE